MGQSDSLGLGLKPYLFCLTSQCYNQDIEYMIDAASTHNKRWTPMFGGSPFQRAIEKFYASFVAPSLKGENDLES